MPLGRTTMKGMHRTMSSYVNAFLAAGFAIERMIEPAPNAEQLRKCPENEDNLRVPLFVIWGLRKM
jgi:hypothetical protein